MFGNEKSNMVETNSCRIQNCFQNLLMPIYYNNQAIVLVKNLESCKRFKHIDTQYYFIYEKYRIKEINIKYI